MVRLSCGIRTTRMILFVLNIVFFVFGLTIFGFGIYLATSKKFDVAFFDDVNVEVIGGKAIESVGIALIVIGFFTALVSALGGIGTLYKKPVLLYIYAVVLAVLMLMELAAVITALVLRVDIRDTYENNLWNIFEDAYVRNRTDVRNAVEKLEARFKCCGVHDFEDYISVNRTSPPSCHENSDPLQALYGTGCAEAIIEWIWDELPIVGGILGAVFFLEIFGVIASIATGVAISHYSYGQILYKG